MSTPNRKRPSGPPASAGVLAKYTQAYARSSGVAEGRVHGWVAHMALAGALERSVQVAKDNGLNGYLFTIKGGVALELRLRERARATKDIDLVLHDSVAELAVALERAIASGYQGFQFQRRREPVVLDNGTVRVQLAATYRGGTWTMVSVDIARAEPGEAEVELLDAVALESTLGITGPDRVPCLSLRYHVAQKLHGMTLPPQPGKRNERFKDLIDLMLMEALISDCTGLREACERVFESRATHAWPPLLTLPEHWRQGYTKLAIDLELPVTDAAEAMERVRALVARIQAVF
ncbi:MAG: hypothetical protein C0497_15840 [Gemmatimonas sp.]|nr:hypothetical protein [Gemmatimonas sp.]